MPLYEQATRAELAEIIEIEGEGEYIFNRDLHVTERDGYVVVLIEKLRGVVKTEVQRGNLAAKQMRDRVELYILHAASDFRQLNLRISSDVGAAFRVTIGFFRAKIEEAKKDFPCKLCKAGCRLILSVILAHVGIPYLDLGGVGEAIALGDHADQIGDILSDPLQAGNDLVTAFLQQNDIGLLLALREALKVVEWVLDAEEKVFTATCERVGCCP